MRNVLVSGGAGYVGSALVPELLKKGYEAVVFDTFWYWKSPQEFLEKTGLLGNRKIKVVKGDLRNVDDIKKALENVDTVIQLASISNDPSSDLDEKFTHSVNYDGNVNIIDESKKAGVKRFIYASSASVYGVKEEPNVTEDIKLEPLTQYSRLKAEIENYLLSQFDDKFKGVIIRPSTVCGYSQRLRLDVVVNILTNLAINKGKIKVFGGEQLRPNIHIRDMVDLYILLVEIDIDKINKKIFNVGWENLKVIEIAKIVQKIVKNVDVEYILTDDTRSYHISSKKITDELGFKPKHTVEDAVRELKKAFEEGKIENPDDDKYYNIKLMKKLLGV